MKALPQFANGTMEIPHDMIAKIHKGEAVIPSSFMESIRSGKLTLLGPQGAGGQSSSDNRTINININGATKSGAQLYQEMAPYIGSVRKVDQGAFKGLFKG